MGGNYSVYMHTFPNGKIYIGITSQAPERRWQGGGSGYRTQQRINAAIEQYGWENVEHQIIASGLSQEEAEALEADLISQYRSADPEHGYNVMTNAHGGYEHHQPETIAKMKAAPRSPVARKVRGKIVEAYPTLNAFGLKMWAEFGYRKIEKSYKKGDINDFAEAVKRFREQYVIFHKPYSNDPLRQCVEIYERAVGVEKSFADILSEENERKKRIPLGRTERWYARHFEQLGFERITKEEYSAFLSKPKRRNKNDINQII